MTHIHHHHHHHHHHGHDADDTPLDAANQSLADALKASFGILKFIMFILVIMYCLSGLQCIDTKEEAVVLRFGKLLPGVRPSGLSVAFPYPIDETIVVTTKQDNKLLVKHWPHLRPGQEGEPLNKVRGGGGLDPTLDGALLTADKGMVHMQWAIIYRITDLRDYVRYFAEGDFDKTETLIADLVDNAAIRVAADYSADDITRSKTVEAAKRVRVLVNENLEALKTGVSVINIDVPKSSVPGQTMAAFDAVTRAENAKEKMIRDSEKQAADILTSAAGEQYPLLLEKIDAYDAAILAEDSAKADEVSAEINDMLETVAGGDAGQAIRRARSYYTNVVQQVRGDVNEYESALVEYLASPKLFINRMWEQTRSKLLANEGVRKHYTPRRVNELRIKIGVDPEQRRLDEQRKLQEEAGDYDFSKPKGIHAINPSNM